MCIVGIFHYWSRWERVSVEIWDDGKIIGHKTAIVRECYDCGKVQRKYL